jgi:hypothetical protein
LGSVIERDCLSWGDKSMIKIVKIMKKEWEQFSENSHLIVFKERRPVSLDRYDFALVAEGELSQMMGYITCREHDAESLYWQFGGAYPGTKNTSNAWEMYKLALEWTEMRYERVFTLVANDNYPMLHMHMKSGFVINGFRVVNDMKLVELHREFSE